MNRNIDEFLSSQKTLQFYNKTREAFSDVLRAVSDKEYEKITDNLYIMALHEEVAAQVMHFPKIDSKFKIMQITIKDSYGPNDLRFIIAHELAHVLQGRNWQEGDGDDLEDDADKQAITWGFKRDKEVTEKDFGDMTKY